MDALQGYGSSSDSEADHPGPTAGAVPHQQHQEPGDKQLQRPMTTAPVPAQSQGPKLPSAAELFGPGAQSSGYDLQLHSRHCRR